MSVSCRAHGCIFLSFLLKRQKITTVGSERQKITTVGSERQKKSAMGRSVPKRWAQVDFTDRWGGERVVGGVLPRISVGTWGLCARLCLVLVCGGRYGLGEGFFSSSWDRVWAE